MKRVVQGEYSLTKTWGWSILEQRFNLPHEQPMRSLIQQIAKSRFSEGIFGTTSLFDLIIVQKPIFEMGRDELRVSMTSTGRIHFRYVESAWLKKNFETESASGDAFAKFELIMINRLKWFFSEVQTNSND